MLTAPNETTKRSQEIVATSDGALRVDPSGSRYQDLGLIVDASSVAAGAFVWSSYLDNIQWVRNLVFLVKSDQLYRVFIAARDTNGISNSDANNDSLINSTPASGSTYRLHRAGTAASNPGFLGYSAKFGVKNEGTLQASLIQLRMQLLGL